jgi:hypothetical protein
MANNPLGAITEIANAIETRLAVSKGSGEYDYYALCKELELSIGRTEQRDVVTDASALYSYGAGDNFLSATLVYSGPEIDGTDYTNATTAASFNDLTQGDGDGALEEINWLLIVKDVSGSEKFFTLTGVLRNYVIRKGAEGKTEVDIFIRLTNDTITIGDVAPA